MQQYPKIINDKNATQVLQTISRLRDEDITDRNNFPATFVLGRKVGRVPVSSVDVVDGDKLNDINWDADHIYILSTPGEWRRVALSSW